VFILQFREFISQPLRLGHVSVHSIRRG